MELLNAHFSVASLAFLFLTLPLSLPVYVIIRTVKGTVSDLFNGNVTKYNRLSLGKEVVIKLFLTTFST